MKILGYIGVFILAGMFLPSILISIILGLWVLYTPIRWIKEDKKCPPN